MQFTCKSDTDNNFWAHNITGAEKKNLWRTPSCVEGEGLSSTTDVVEQLILIQCNAFECIIIIVIIMITIIDIIY